MNNIFKPCMEVLPAAQQRLWQELSPVGNLGFVLYGGTAIALRLGHRTSVDFDFFSEQPLDRETLQATLPFMQQTTVLQDERHTLTVLIPYNDVEHSHIKISFFGTIGFGRVGQPDYTEDRILQVASLKDLMATKLKVILQRAEVKDYHDIAVMIKAGVSLPHGLAAACKIFGQTFQPSESLKALVYFGDGDLSTLSTEVKSTLINAANAVQELPDVVILSHVLALKG
jgi:hypothetical protein